MRSRSIPISGSLLIVHGDERTVWERSQGSLEGLRIRRHPQSRQRVPGRCPPQLEDQPMSATFQSWLSAIGQVLAGNELNNREWATLVWLGVGIVCVLWWKPLRQPVLDLVRTAALSLFGLL